MAILANIFIDQGTDFTITVDVADSVGEALNMTGYTAAGQIRKTYSSSTVAATFVTSIVNATGAVTMTLTDTVTAALGHGRYVYDLNVTSSGGVTTRVVEGQAIVTPGVTR
jgi:uncharacterized lipoprotein NlpE involved in copper resistance|tara:strand:+ start:111 stop:443 length:333 start_codon:yes stop_codon:yes gene_type:complete